MAACVEESSGNDESESWKDTNVGNIGSDMDKDARKQAASTEEAWDVAGLEQGIQIWRIEKFKVVVWPAEEYGNFYSGDSYIVLHTTADPESGKLLHDIHFWIGSHSTQDEYGTAAYKTVELDDFFDGEPQQHRETQGHESAEFKSLFREISYLEGGVDTGFSHVEEGAFIAKLLQVRKEGKLVRVAELPLSAESINDGDCFILDAGLIIYTWYGSAASAFEKNKCGAHAKKLEDKRLGRGSTVTLEHDDGGEEANAFWNALGGRPDSIKSAAEGDVYAVPDIGEGVLSVVSDENGTLSCIERARGDLMKDMLDTKDVFIVDTTREVFVWIGLEASDYERRQAMPTAIQYLQTKSLPPSTPIHTFKEGRHFSAPLSPSQKIWNDIFSN